MNQIPNRAQSSIQESSIIWVFCKYNKQIQGFKNKERISPSNQEKQGGWEKIMPTQNTFYKFRVVPFLRTYLVAKPNSI